MDGIETALLVFAVGAVAGWLNVMAAGGSLLVLPMLIFLGLPPVLANGTNRVAILFQSVAAVGAFRRHGATGLGAGLRLGLLTLPGAVLGAWTAVKLPDEWFRAILALVIVLGVVGMLVPLERRDAVVERVPTGPLAVVLMFGAGFYGGFIQAGVGIVLMLALHRGLHLGLVETNVHKTTVTAVYTVPALLVFVWSGQVAWAEGLVLAAGSTVGGVVATRTSMRGGERVIRRVLAIVLLGMAVRLVVGG